MSLLTEEIPMRPDDQLAAGARNLLLNCAGLKARDRLLIVHEDPSLGWYDKAAPLALGTEAEAMGISTAFVEVGGPEDDESSLTADRASADCDCVVYMARIGDLDRFEVGADNKIRIMCYARDADALASAYGRTHHDAMLELKDAVNDVLLGADRIEVSCPLGTDFSCDITDQAREFGDVAVQRFPVGVPQAILAEGLNGRVALARYLTPTGNRSYEPASLAFDEIVFANVKMGRIKGYEGDTATVADVECHYKIVSDIFGIDPECVHSWHAGIHAGAAFNKPAADDPDRWSNNVFTNPRFLHIHTCGAYAPGEICWMVLDPTVSVEGKNLWQDGRLCLEEFAPLRQAAQKWPILSDLMANPSDEIGLSG